MVAYEIRIEVTRIVKDKQSQKEKTMAAQGTTPYQGNILDAFFEKRHETLRTLASNPGTNFEVTVRENDRDNFSNPMNYNVFHYCFVPGALDGLAENRLLAIKKGVDNLEIRTQSLVKALKAKCADGGKTPLHLAAASNSTEKACKLAKWLLEMGADPTVANDIGETPDQRALRGNVIGLRIVTGVSSTPAIHRLLVNAKSKAKSLIDCFREGNFSAANRCLDELQGRGLDALDANESDRQKNSFLMLAIKGGKEHKIPEENILQILRTLVELKDDINQQNKRDETVLSLAVVGDYCRIVEYLLFEVDVDVKKSTTRFGDTILHTAAEANASLEIIQLFLNSSARELLNYRNQQKQLPLHFVKRLDVCDAFCKAAPDVLTKETIAQLRKLYGRLSHSDYREMSRVLDSYDSDLSALPVTKDFQQWGGEFLDELSKSVVLPVLEHVGGATVDVVTTGIDEKKKKIKEKLLEPSPASSSDS